MLANDNLPEDVASALAYLKDGGLGEVMGFADICRKQGLTKVQLDTDMAIALCFLAADSAEGASA